MLMQKHAFLMSVLLPLRLDLGLPPDMQNNSNTICFLVGYLPHQLRRYRATASIFVLHVVPRSMDGFTIFAKCNALWLLLLLLLLLCSR